MNAPSVTVDNALMVELFGRFAPDAATGVFLAGSRARGTSGPYSDVDWVRVVSDDTPLPGDGSYLLDGRLVVVSTLRPDFVAEIFSNPEVACDYILGLRDAQILLDRTGEVARLQQRARAFVWDSAMQQKANEWAAGQMVGIIEEAHKGLEGLRRNDIGRMLNARFGLSWLITGIVKVQQGILLTSDNGVWDEVNRAVGEGTEWVHLRRISFGIDDGYGHSPTLREQILAGLKLYTLTAKLLDHTMPSKEREMVRETVTRIEDELGRIPHGDPSNP